MNARRAAKVSALGLVACSLSCGPIGSEGSAPAPTSPGPGSTPSSGAAASTAVGGTDAAGSAASGENTTTGCSVPPLPIYADLTDDPTLPDPFMSLDGTRITSTAQWTCRRAEIMAQAQLYELGTKPPKPSMVSGSFANDTITVNASDNGQSTSFTSTVQYPTTGTPPYPAMIGLEGIDIGPTELQQMGVALITFPASTIAQQNDASSRGQGDFYDVYGSNASAGAMIAWAWGICLRNEPGC